ncbi:phospholipase ABHD3-like [Periplaneta americana]|uniref:phospholipase ABHD3-like n=1 Tax=Periplaneta americana TaxID=6978 RepID=UPI0037E89E45
MDWLMSPASVLLDLPGWYLAAVLGTGFFTYYLFEVVKQPVLVCADGKFKDFLSKHVPALQEKYWPSLWCFEARFHTAFASLLRSIQRDIKYKREILNMSDGGHVGLDWLETGCPDGAPIMLILPGLTGDSQSSYVKVLATAANRMKLRVVVFNYRGLGGMSLKTPRTYNASNPEDLSYVVNHVKSQNPGSVLVASGISMGGLLLSKYFSTQQSVPEKPVLAGMVISPPWNVLKAMDNLEKPGLNFFLNRYLASGFMDYRSRHENSLEGPWDMQEILKSKTVRDFDSSYTAKQFGYRDANHYYSDASMHDKLHKIEIPLLSLSAGDDPVQPLAAIPIEEASKSKYVAIAVTTRGGHIGFLEGILPFTYEDYMSRVFTQYFTAILTSGKDLLASMNKHAD